MPDVRDVEPWPEPVDGRVLLDELKWWLTRFAVLPKWAAEILALWVLHTFAFLLRDTSTYLGIESPIRRCGKTTLMSVLHDLVNRPVASSNISPPAFFHAIDELRPTLFIDEGDNLLPGNAEVRGLLNSGYKRKMAYVLRLANQESEASAQKSGGKRSRLVRYSFFCPKVMAQIGRLPETLADRCIIFRMQRKTPEDKCERLRTIDGTRLKRQCARFVQDHAAAIASASPAIPARLNDRQADIGEPLLVLADLAGGPWPEAARQAMVGLSESAEANDPMESLLLDIQLIFTNLGVERAFSRTLVSALNLLANRPWAEMRQGKKITDQWLGRQLQGYEIASKTMRIGKALAKGYVAADFREVIQRYFMRDGDEKSESRDQTSEAEQKSDDGGRKAEDGDEKSEFRDQTSEAKDPEQKSDDGGGQVEDGGRGGQRDDERGEDPGGEAAAA
jgi:hypothetical protein